MCHQTGNHLVLAMTKLDEQLVWEKQKRPQQPPRAMSMKKLICHASVVPEKARVGIALIL